LQKNTDGYYDIILNEQGNFVTINEALEIAQDITTRILFIKNSWFLNLDLGVDYYGVVFANSSTRNAVDQEFIDIILGTDGVQSLIEYRSNIKADRSFQVVFNAQTISGQTGTTAVNLGSIF
jgi:hypothetical protein